VADDLRVGRTMTAMRRRFYYAGAAAGAALFLCMGATGLSAAPAGQPDLQARLKQFERDLREL
jgi:hypothetical protein